jgi:hypothetical protein
MMNVGSDTVPVDVTIDVFTIHLIAINAQYWSGLKPTTNQIKVYKLASTVCKLTFETGFIQNFHS